MGLVEHDQAGLTSILERVWRWEDPGICARELPEMQQELARFQTASLAAALAPIAAHLATAVGRYAKALVAFPAERYEQEVRAHEVLLEGVILSTPAWQAQFSASERRLAALRDEWRRLSAEAARLTDETWSALDQLTRGGME
jgi:hypothetical protein